jgi:hypothetical protein
MYRQIHTWEVFSFIGHNITPYTLTAYTGSLKGNNNKTNTQNKPHAAQAICTLFNILKNTL